MAQIAKFHKKAVMLLVNRQVADGTSAINDSPTGTITTSVGSANVTGSGTTFTTQVAVGMYLFTTANAIIGRVKTVTSNTAIVLEDVVPAGATAQSAGVMAIATAVTGVAFKIGMGPKNAIAVLDLTPNEELDTESFQYAGDELDRDEETTVKDRYYTLEFSTLVPYRGAIAGGDPTLQEIPYSDLFQACGLGIVLSTGSAGHYTIGNDVSSNVYLTVELRRSSPDLAGANTQKVVMLKDCRGQVDLDIAVGSRASFKWRIQGNIGTTSDKFTVVPNFQSQKTTISDPITVDTIGLSALDLYSGSTEPSPSASSNFCMDKINAPNVSGFEYNRYKTGCGDGWSKGAVPTDVTVTILEDSATATYVPQSHYSENHRLTLRYGITSALTTAGKRNEIVFHKVKLASTGSGEVADYSGVDLTFRNTGTFNIKFY